MTATLIIAKQLQHTHMKKCNFVSEYNEYSQTLISAQVIVKQHRCHPIPYMIKRLRRKLDSVQLVILKVVVKLVITVSTHHYNCSCILILICFALNNNQHMVPEQLLFRLPHHSSSISANLTNGQSRFIILNASMKCWVCPRRTEATKLTVQCAIWTTQRMTFCAHQLVREQKERKSIRQ